MLACNCSDVPLNCNNQLLHLQGRPSIDVVVLIVLMLKWCLCCSHLPAINKSWDSWYYCLQLNRIFLPSFFCLYRVDYRGILYRDLHIFPVSFVTSSSCTNSVLLRFIVPVLLCLKCHIHKESLSRFLCIHNRFLYS